MQLSRDNSMMAIDVTLNERDFVIDFVSLQLTRLRRLTHGIDVPLGIVVETSDDHKWLVQCLETSQLSVYDFTKNDILKPVKYDNVNDIAIEYFGKHHLIVAHTMNNNYSRLLLYKI
ncbi:unnamed protein product [Didymodactylos carnosus]|nr:unnamed protein product [Didymodactylos carnosus]CAF3554465.1 unnamed protein product [Didymodactylos carnosus]